VFGVLDEVEDDDALAIAAPPPATAAVTAAAVSTDLIRMCVIHLLCALLAGAWRASVCSS